MGKHLRKISSLILALIMIITMMPNLAFAEESSELQLVDGVYQITNAGDLQAFAKKVNEGEKDAKAKLIKDLDLSSITKWESIKEFSGEFDGNGKKLKFKDVTMEALFTTMSGTVHDIADITGNVTAENGNGAGIAYRNEGLIKNCKASIKFIISDKKKRPRIYLGGIATYNDKDIFNCQFAGVLTVKEDLDAMNYIGGIAGFNVAPNGQIIGCFNTGEIYNSQPEDKFTRSEMGGIVGRIDKNGNCKIRSCQNSGHIHGKAKNTYAGGILGYPNQEVLITNCFNTGEIKGAKQGAIVGASNKEKIENCYFIGSGAANAISQADANTDTTIAKLNKASSDYTPEGDNLFVIGEKVPTLKYLLTNVEAVPVKKVIIEGEHKTGATLKAVATGTDGKAATNVTYQWYNVDSYYDELTEEDEESLLPIKDATEQTFMVADDSKQIGKLYRVAVKGENGSKCESSDFKITSASETLKLTEDLEAIKLVPNGKIKDEKAVVTENDNKLLSEGKKHKSKITWRSSNTDYVDHDGTVKKRPVEKSVELTLTAKAEIGGISKSKEFRFVVYSEASGKDAAVIEEAKTVLKDKLFKPDSKFDTNLKDHLLYKLKDKNIDGIEITELKDIKKCSFPKGGNTAIASDGTLTYLDIDPLTIHKTNGNANYGNFELKVVIKKGEATVEVPIKVHLSWDRDKLVNSLTKALETVTWDKIKAENDSQDSVVKDLTLPRILKTKADDGSYCSIKWHVNNDSAVKITDGKDPILGDFIGKITRAEEEQSVTLEATLDYKFAESENDKAAVAKICKSFNLKIPALDVAAIKADMQKELDAGYTEAKLKDSVTKNIIDPNAVENDVQLPMPKKLGIKNYDSYKFTYSVPENIDAQVNGYRLNVFRPLHNEEPITVDITVKMSQKSNPNIFVEKTIPIVVKPLGKDDITNAKKFMNKVVAGYFDGIKGENKDPENITKDMRSFQEATLDSEGNLRFIYRIEDRVDNGIIPETYVENTVSGGSDSQYTYFNVNKPNVIKSGNLLLNGKPEYDTRVKIDSYLSSAVFGKYYKHYSKKGNTEKAAIFKPLHRQYAVANVIVKGEKGEDPNPNSKINVFLKVIGRSQDDVWIKKEAITLDKEAMAWDMLKLALESKGFKYEGNGAYISGISGPDGKMLRHKEHGENSGWMYRYNGILSNKLLQEQELRDGDYIYVFYSDDGEKEPDFVDLNEPSEPEPQNPEQPEAPKKPEWKQDKDGSWYVVEKGEKKKGWYEDKETYPGWYFFDEAGKMKTGWHYDESYKAWFFLSNNGKMETGWVEVAGSWYYLENSGKMKTGWLELGNTWYYLKSSGAMATGWEEVAGTWYYLENSGAMKTGWLELGNTWYYLKSSGAMATDWEKINGTWYRFASSGAWIA